MRGFFLCFIAMVITCCSLNAQSHPDPFPVSKRARKIYSDAIRMYRGGQHEKAITKLEGLISAEPNCAEAALSLAEWYYNDHRLGDAARALESIVALDSLYMPRTLYSLGRIYLQTGEFRRSRILLQRFLESGSKDSRLLERATEYFEKAAFAEDLIAHPVPFSPEPIPGPVNSDNSESLPAFTVDGRYLFFTRLINGQEDIYRAQWDPATEVWGFAESLTAINTGLNEGAHAVSADGSVLAFTACGRPDGRGSCDLYLWIRKSGVWQRPVNAGHINSPGWDGHPAIAPDGSSLYFSSDRPGGMGGRDIWYTQRQGDQWSDPVNLGSPVNTAGNEESPFLFFDNRTLYFMSDGHPGLGSFDLFVSTRSAGTWSAPKNLGYPINTHDREGALAVTPDRTYAYYTSDRNGQNDIYRFVLDTTLLPPPVSNIQGVVVNAVNNTPVVADVVIYDLIDSTEHYTYTTDDAGLFSAVLVHGRRYGIHVTAPSFAFWSDQIFLDPSDAYRQTSRRIPLIPLRNVSSATESSPVILRNVEFAFGSASILPSSLAELRRLSELLADNPDLRIEIRGHTDDVGSDTDNQILSEARALAVYTYLRNHGIEEVRLSYRGFGETSPIASNATDTGRQENRRVEFVILEE